MRYTLLIIFFTIKSALLFPQIVLTIEGTEVVDTTTGISPGVNIPRSQPTLLTYRNNSIVAMNSLGYMLQAGDEQPGVNNHHLDRAMISGNRLIWNGSDANSTTHGLFTGYNTDVIIRYNFLDNVPNGIQRKSNGMTDQSGFIAYNIIKNSDVSIVVKGMNGVRIFNNTLYTEKTPAQTTRGLIDIHTNTDDGLNAASAGAKIFNNIFYTKYPTLNIKIYESTCLSGFESDYNLFWCESGEPVFEIAGSIKTFAEWQALGYDQHSVVINPDFNDLNYFVPKKRLDYGKNLGPMLIQGLSVDASWGKTNPETTYQNSTWQVGARVFKGTENEIFIFPNPAIDKLYVLITDVPSGTNYFKVYDLNGRLVMEGIVEQGLNSINIPANLLMGIYNVTVETDARGRFVKKILFVNGSYDK